MAASQRNSTDNRGAEIKVLNSRFETLLSEDFSRTPATSEEQAVLDRIAAKLEQLRSLMASEPQGDDIEGQQMRTSIMKDLQGHLDEIEALASEALA